MTNYQIGDLLLVDFPFTASGPGKPRPALVILDTALIRGLRALRGPLSFFPKNWETTDSTKATDGSE